MASGPKKMKSAFQYVCMRDRFPVDKQVSLSSSLVDNVLSHSNGELFRKNLYAHYGCVNAIEFSEDGSLLASGGDDKRVLIWNVHQAIVSVQRTTPKPIVLQAAHRSNVFALAFVSSQQKIISAGNDEQVIVHDIHTGKPLDYFLQEQPVFGVSCDPLNDNIFSVAGDDGRILIYDMRDSSNDPFCLAKYHSPFHSVMFHPVEPRLILSSNAKEGAALWDIRMAKKVLLKYGRQIGDPDSCMNARFNRNGSRVLSLRRRLPPVLYSTQSSSHLFQFNHPSYYNSCTMKSCSFGGDGDEFIISGSDNFDLVCWKIPNEGSNRWVSEANLILKGHRSIVNQVRYNYAHHLIASSGVEKMVKIWSPFAIPDESSWIDDEPGKTSESPRQIFSHEEYVRLYMRTSHGHLFSMSRSQDSLRNTDEDSRMLAFFDALVQRDIVGLSEEEESDADSTYTNTVYSTGNSSSDDGEGTEPLIGPLPALTARERFIRNRRLLEPPSSSDDNNSEDEPRLLDMDDLPIIESSSSDDDQVVVHRRSSSPDANHNNLVSSRPSVGTSEPNTLTELITSRESQLRKLASNNDKQPAKSKHNKDEEAVAQLSSPATGGSDGGSSTSTSGSSSPLPLRHPCRRRSVLTPIYESSSSDTRTPAASTGPGYQLINNLMTRTLPPPLQTNNNSSHSISIYSSSSSSSSNSSDDDNTESSLTVWDLFSKASTSSSSSPQQFSATEDERTQDLTSCGYVGPTDAPATLTETQNKKVSSRKFRVAKVLKNAEHNTDGNNADRNNVINSSDSSTLSSQSNVDSILRKRKRRKKSSAPLVNCTSKRLKSGTSDSGIDVSKSDVDIDLQPIAGCSHHSRPVKKPSSLPLKQEDNKSESD